MQRWDRDSNERDLSVELNVEQDDCETVVLSLRHFSSFVRYPYKYRWSLLPCILDQIEPALYRGAQCNAQSAMRRNDTWSPKG